MFDHPRIMAKLVGGLYDGQYYSVHADQTEIIDIGDMPEGSKYIRDETSIRDFYGEEAALADLSFADHGLTNMAEYEYVESSE